MHKAKAALLVALLLAAPVSAKVAPEDLYALAKSQAILFLGLSPAGADIYARRAVAVSERGGRFDAVSRLKVAMGEELAREVPDRSRVAKLRDAVAREQAKDARRQYEELIVTAFELSDADRRKLGTEIARANGEAIGF